MNPDRPAVPTFLGFAGFACAIAMLLLQSPWPVLPMLALFSLAAAQQIRHHHRILRRSDGRCANCGYDLRATPGRCPECGATP